MISATLGLNIAPFTVNIEKVRDKLNNLAAAANIFTGASLFGEQLFAGLEGGFEKIRGILDLGGELNDLSANTGQSVGDLVVLKQAFKDAGLGADSVAPIIAKFQKALSGVNEEGEPTNATLEKLKLNFAGFREMSALDQLKELQHGFAGITNPIDRTRMAMDLFGKSGAKMLALLGDTEAFALAEKQVGGFGRLMQEMAPVFDAISDNIATLGEKGRELIAGFLSRVAPALGGLQKLTTIDLTPLGQNLGDAAEKVASCVSKIASFADELKAIAEGMAIVFIASRAQSLLASSGLTALSVAIRNPREALKGLVALLSAKAGENFFASALTGLRGMLNSTVAVTAAIAGMMWAWNHYQERREAVGRGALGKVDSDLTAGRLESIKEISQVGNESEKTAEVDKLTNKLADLHQRMASVNEDFASLGSSGEADTERAEIAERLGREATATELLIQRTQSLSAAQMKHNEAAHQHKQLVDQQAEAVKKLVDEYEKLKGEMAKAQRDSLPATQQKAAILAQTPGSGSTADLDRAIALYEKNAKNRAELGKDRGAVQQLDEQQRRLGIMIEARRELISVEKKITEERQRQLEKAEEQKKKDEEAARKRADFIQSSQLDIAKTLAESRGDKKEVDRLDRQQRYGAAFKEATGGGQRTMEADIFARSKVAVQDAARSAEEKQKERDEFSKRAAEGNRGVAVSNARRVGGGGNVGGGGGDPLLREAQRQQRELSKQTELLKTLVDRTKPANGAPPTLKSLFG